MGLGKVQRGRASSGYNHHPDSRYALPGSRNRPSPRMNRYHRHLASPYHGRQPLQQSYPSQHIHYSIPIQSQWGNNVSESDRRMAMLSGSPRVMSPRGHLHGNHVTQQPPSVNQLLVEEGRLCDCGNYHPDHQPDVALHHHFEWSPDVNRDVIVRPRSCLDTTPKWCVGLPLFLGAIFLVIGGFFTDKSSFIGHGIIFFIVSTVCLAFGTFLLLLEICICSYLCMGQETRRSITTCTCCQCCCCQGNADKNQSHNERESLRQIQMTEIPSRSTNVNHNNHSSNSNSVFTRGSSRERHLGNDAEQRIAALTTINETTLNIENESSCSNTSMRVERPTSYLCTDRRIRETATPPPTLRTTSNCSMDSLNCGLQIHNTDDVECLQESGLSLPTNVEISDQENGHLTKGKSNYNNHVSNNFESEHRASLDKRVSFMADTPNQTDITDGDSLSGDSDDDDLGIDNMSENVCFEKEGMTECHSLIMNANADDLALNGKRLPCDENADDSITTDQSGTEDEEDTYEDEFEEGLVHL